MDNESSELNADNMGCQTFLNKNQIDHLETKEDPVPHHKILWQKTLYHPLSSTFRPF
jgi:hypothetical protein